MKNLTIHNLTLQTILKDLKKYNNKFTLGFLTGDRLGSKIAVTGISIPRQRSKIYETSVSDSEITKSLLRMMKAGQQCVGVGIYQTCFKLYLSFTNKEMMEKLSKQAGGSMICLVCNQKSGDVLWRMFRAK